MSDERAAAIEKGRQGFLVWLQGTRLIREPLPGSPDYSPQVRDGYLQRALMEDIERHIEEAGGETVGELGDQRIRRLGSILWLCAVDEGARLQVLDYILSTAGERSDRLRFITDRSDQRVAEIFSGVDPTLELTGRRIAELPSEKQLPALNQVAQAAAVMFSYDESLLPKESKKAALSSLFAAVDAVPSTESSALVEKAGAGLLRAFGAGFGREELRESRSEILRRTVVLAPAHPERAISILTSMSSDETTELFRSEKARMAAVSLAAGMKFAYCDDLKAAKLLTRDLAFLQILPRGLPETSRVVVEKVLELQKIYFDERYYWDNHDVQQADLGPWYDLVKTHLQSLEPEIQKAVLERVVTVDIVARCAVCRQNSYYGKDRRSYQEQAEPMITDLVNAAPEEVLKEALSRAGQGEKHRAEEQIISLLELLAESGREKFLKERDRKGQTRPRWVAILDGLRIDDERRGKILLVVKNGIYPEEKQTKKFIAVCLEADHPGWLDLVDILEDHPLRCEVNKKVIAKNFERARAELTAALENYEREGNIGVLTEAVRDLSPFVNDALFKVDEAIPWCRAWTFKLLSDGRMPFSLKKSVERTIHCYLLFEKDQLLAILQTLPESLPNIERSFCEAADFGEVLGAVGEGSLKRADFPLRRLLTMTPAERTGLGGRDDEIMKLCLRWLESLPAVDEETVLTRDQEEIASSLRMEPWSRLLEARLRRKDARPQREKFRAWCK